MIWPSPVEMICHINTNVDLEVWQSQVTDVLGQGSLSRSGGERGQEE